MPKPESTCLAAQEAMKVCIPAALEGRRDAGAADLSPKDGSKKTLSLSGKAAGSRIITINLIQYTLI